MTPPLRRGRRPLFLGFYYFLNIIIFGCSTGVIVGCPKEYYVCFPTGLLRKTITPPPVLRGS